MFANRIASRPPLQYDHAKKKDGRQGTGAALFSGMNVEMVLNN